MGDDRRIRDEVVDLDQGQVRDFFEKRGKRIDPCAPVTSVLYQDKNPEIAALRDAYESRKIKALLSLHGHERVLDVGCGIGRWAEHLGAGVAGGVGLDVASSLVEFARSRTLAVPWAFETMSADQISRDQLASLGFSAPFDLAIVSGVCIYLNDEMLARALRGIAEVTRAGSVVYVREPVAREGRLTLKAYWSKELGDTYNAIYRSREEYAARFEDTFAGTARTLYEGPMYDDDRLNNRSETFQYFWILRRTDG